MAGYLLLPILLFCVLYAEETYTDPETALMWQDSPENREHIHTWSEAKEYCEALQNDGYSDWWLPSEAELFTIVDTSRPRGRRIARGFVHFKGAPYWSSSTYAWNAPHAWVVDFAGGTSFTLEKRERRFVRCVRCSDFKRCLELFYNKEP